MSEPLTPAAIAALPAGSETDALVAEAIGMGWQGGNPIPGYDGRWPWPPPFSTDWNAMQQAIEHYQRREVSCYVGLFPSRPSLKSRVEVVWPRATAPDWHTLPDVLSFDGRTLSVRAETLPLAVCRALLLVKWAEKQEGAA